MDNDLNVKEAFDGMKAVLRQSGPGPPGFRRVHGPGKRLREIDPSSECCFERYRASPEQVPAALFASRSIHFESQLRLDSEHFYLLDSLTSFYN